MAGRTPAIFVVRARWPVRWSTVNERLLVRIRGHHLSLCDTRSASPSQGRPLGLMNSGNLFLEMRLVSLHIVLQGLENFQVIVGADNLSQVRCAKERHAVPVHDP